MTREDIMRELMETTYRVHKDNLHKDFYDQAWVGEIAYQAAKLDVQYAVEFIRDQFTRRQQALTSA